MSAKTNRITCHLSSTVPPPPPLSFYFRSLKIDLLKALGTHTVSSPLSTRRVVSVGFYIRSVTLKILDSILFFRLCTCIAKLILGIWFKIKPVFDFRWNFFIGGTPVELQLLLSITLNQSTSIGKHDSNNSCFVNFFVFFFLLLSN